MAALILRPNRRPPPPAPPRPRATLGGISAAPRAHWLHLPSLRYSPARPRQRSRAAFPGWGPAGSRGPAPPRGTPRVSQSRGRRAGPGGGGASCHPGFQAGKLRLAGARPAKVTPEVEAGLGSDPRLGLESRALRNHRNTQLY